MLHSRFWPISKSIVFYSPISIWHCDQRNHGPILSYQPEYHQMSQLHMLLLLLITVSQNLHYQNCQKNTLEILVLIKLGTLLLFLHISKTIFNQPTIYPTKHQTLLLSILTSHAKVVKSTIPPPQLHTDMTHPQFRKFKIDWDVYKQLTNIPTTNIATQLYYICDDALQHNVVNTIPIFLHLQKMNFFSF